MDTKKIAKAVKAHLVNLAVNDKLPMDMTQLSLSKLEKVIKSALPTEEELRFEKAGNYLCDSCENTIEEQIKLIDAQAKVDDSEMLDMVEGVSVWEKVENSFTVREFLDLIEA